MSFRDHLEGFLAHTEHVRNLLARGEDGYQQEFMTLKTQSQRYKTEKTYSTKAGEHELNIRKNRYKDILPFDYTRIKLSEIEGVPASDYINASYVKGYSGKNTYAAAQGPLPQTVLDFWRMVWETEATIILMSCNEYEMGKHKCERYWVDEGKTQDFNDITVSMISQRRVNPDFLIRTLKVKKDSEERIINQFHYNAWPDHGVPNSVLPIIEMIQLVRDYQPHDDIPLVVHCSAGCGRTGTICVIDYVFNQLKQEAITADFSLFDIVREMRQQRPAMVQTRDQYELVHRAVATMFNRQLEERFEDYNRVYENVHLQQQVDKTRMPPAASKIPASPCVQRKRHSDHNYVNYNLPGQTDSDAVRIPRVPTIPGKFRHSADSATLDAPIYENLQDEIEGNSSEELDSTSPSSVQAGLKHRKSFKKNMDIFSDLEKDFGFSKGATQTNRTPPSPKKPVPPTKPVVNAKNPGGNGGGGKPSPPLKPNYGKTADRPVPKERKHAPADSKTDRSGSPQPGQKQSSPPLKNTELRRKSGSLMEDAPTTSSSHIPAKELVQRSSSMGFNEQTDNESPLNTKKRTSNPHIVSLDKKQFAKAQNQLTEVLAAGKKPSDLKKNDSRSKSMKRPGFSPPKPPSGGLKLTAAQPKPPPALAKPGREWKPHSHDYEPVNLKEPPAKEKDVDKADSNDRTEVPNRLPVNITHVQKTNLIRFSEEDAGSDPSKLYAVSASMRKKQPLSLVSNIDDTKPGSVNDIDIRGKKTLPRQPSQEYAYAQERFGRVEAMLIENETKRGINTGKSRTYASAYSEVSLPSATGDDKEVHANRETEPKATKEAPAKSNRGNLPADTSAYELVTPGELLPGPNSGGKAKTSNVSRDNHEDDVFATDSIDSATYGQYNDVAYIEDLKDSNIGHHGMFEKDDNIGTYGMYNTPNDTVGARVMDSVGIYGVYNADNNDGTYDIYNEVEYQDGSSNQTSRSKNPTSEASPPSQNAEGRESAIGKSTSSARSFTDDEFTDDDGPPDLPERTKASYELLDKDLNQEASKDSETSTTSNKLNAFITKNKEKLHKKKEEIKAGSKGIFTRLGDAVRKPDSGTTAGTVPPSGPPPRPPQTTQINQAEIIEKTLKSLEKQSEHPIMYNNHDISFPNRVPKPKRPRSPPRVWTERSGTAQVSSVQL